MIYSIKPLNDGQIVCNFFNFSQLITEPTRVTESGITLIYHVYSNRPENIGETNVSPFSASDHYPVCITRHSPKLKPKEDILKLNTTSLRILMKIYFCRI